MRRRGCRYKVDQVELERLTNLFGRAQMTEVDRIEAAAE
jgi:hypothetical protein